MPDETINIVVEKVQRETEKAFCFQVGGEDMWMPKSQIRSDVDKDAAGQEVTITEWIAGQKELMSPGPKDTPVGRVPAEPALDLDDVPF